MKKSKNEKSSKEESEKITKSNYDFHLFFCPFCLQFPEYEINIDPLCDISLSHKCLEGVIINKKLSELGEYHRMTYKNTCEHCKRIELNICSKCRKFICDNCIEIHQRPKGIINDEYYENVVIPILKIRNYCKEHLQEVEFYCNICKADLCGKDCINSHYHCKCESLVSYKSKVSPSGYYGSIQYLNDLADIARAFNECFLYFSEKSQLTINIILNFHLIEPINNYINEKVNEKALAKAKNAPKTIIDKEITIRNNFKIPKENVPYLFNSFGDKKFILYYTNLIDSALLGNIDSFHKIIEIKTHYKMNGEDEQNYFFSLRRSYVALLKSTLKKEIDDLRLLSSEKESREYPFILLDTKNQLNKLQKKYNKLEL